MKATRENYIEEQCHKMDAGMPWDDNMKVHQLLRTLTKTGHQKISFIDDVNDHILKESKAVVNQINANGHRRRLRCPHMPM